MSVPQNTDITSYYVNQTSNSNPSGTVVWIDSSNLLGLRNQQQQKLTSSNLTSLKHDHPLIASAIDNNLNRANNGLCHNNDSLLIASLPPTTASIPTNSMSGYSSSFLQNYQQNGSVDSSDLKGKQICLPYGNYYFDESQGQQSTPQEMMENLCYSNNLTVEVLDDVFPDSNYNDQCIYSGLSQNLTGEPSINIENVFQVDKADLKSGPTLAQLNSNLTNDIWDSLDLDDLLINAQNDTKRSLQKSKYGFGLSSGNITTTNNSSNNNGKIANNSGTSIYPMDLEYDAKLQENIDYLTSLLFNSKTNGIEMTRQQSSVQSTTQMPSQSTPVSTTSQQSIAQSSLVTTNNNNSSNNVAAVNNIKNSSTAAKELQIQVTMTVDQDKGLNTYAQNKQIDVVKSENLITNVQTNVSNINKNINIKNANNIIAMEVETNSSRVRNNSMSTEYSASSHDEGFASQQEDSDEDIDSDDESFYGDYDAADLLGASTSDDANNKWSLNMGRSRKGGERRYFWQYNVQAKGPKGTRLASVDDNGDPHVLKEISDPVFSPDCQIEGVKHSGKARRGDGNDLTPNPKKLLMIGLELKKLSKVINDLTPVAEVPLNARSKSRKEKNKLASRACRLKKKAQHEANKIKLFGLQWEHKKAMHLISEIKKLIKKQAERGSSQEVTVSPTVEHLVKTKGPGMIVAGRTSEFVNSILDNVASGISTGGLDKLI